MENAYVEFRNINKSFGEVYVLNDVSLSIPRGAFVTLLGPSGCGKTTLLRQLSGFSEPESGDVLINGKRMNGLPPYKRNTPLVFQEYALFPHMTVYENISYGLKINKVPEKERQAKVDVMLRMFNLEGLEKRFPRELSGGQQQRVAFARALVMGQEILLLDEPLSNLDAKLRVDVRTELRQIQQRLKITTIYVTHDQDEALSMSDIIAVMHGGKIEQVGTPWEIYFKPATRFVADFVGVVNFMEAVVEDVFEGGATALYCGRQFKVASEKNLVPGQAITLAVRPECVSFTEGACDMEGEIVNSSFLGRITRYWVKAGEGVFIVDETKPNFDVRVGRVCLKLDIDRLHLLSDVGEKP